MSKVVSVRNVTKVYGTGNLIKAIHDVSFEIAEGEFLGIMGPSGSGKSTLLNLVATIDKPSNGEILVDGENIQTAKEDQLALFRREKLGFIFQDFNLLDTLTARENIALPLVLSKIRPAEIEEKIKKICEILSINTFLDKFPCELSGGEKQRTAAARALITNPKLILADEPTGALDSRSSMELLQCMDSLNKSQNITIMMVTHDVFAASYCRRILFLKDGKLSLELVNAGSRKEFFHKILGILEVLGGDLHDVI